jgi:hypothetical protein
MGNDRLAEIRSDIRAADAMSSCSGWLAIRRTPDPL